MLAGGALGWLVIIPIIRMIGEGRPLPMYPASVPIDQMAPSDIWNNYLRYIGAGAVAFGGLISLVRAIPRSRVRSPLASERSRARAGTRDSSRALSVTSR